MVTRAFPIVSSRVMSTRTDSQASAAKGTTVSFGEHFAASDQFDAIFKEGMGLVERTAAYLDGPGRKEARALRGPVAVLYATESMRLTTRLLELASWLMIRRALKEGEITPDEARAKRERVKLRGPATHRSRQGLCRPAAGAAPAHRRQLRAERPHLPARPRHRGRPGPGARHRQSRRRAGDASGRGLQQAAPRAWHRPLIGRDVATCRRKPAGRIRGRRRR